MSATADYLEQNLASAFNELNRPQTDPIFGERLAQGSYGGSHLTATGAEARVVNIPDALSGLSNARHSLMEAIDGLSAKLGPILRPSVPTGESNKTERAMDSEVADHIYRESGALSRAAAVIRDLTDRLDL